MRIIIPKLIFPKKIGIHGKIQAWMIDPKTGEGQKIHDEDYYSYKKNTTPDQYCADLATLNAGGTVDVGLKYLGLSTKAAAPQKNSTLEMEKFRVAYSSRTTSGTKVIIEGSFDQTMATEATAIGSTVTSKKVFEISNRTDFNIGDAVAVGPSKEERTIENLVAGSGTIGTVYLDKDLVNLPVTGQDFLQQIGRLHTVYGSTATTTLNSGLGISIAKLRTVKLASKILYVRVEIDYIGS